MTRGALLCGGLLLLIAVAGCRPRPTPPLVCGQPQQHGWSQKASTPELFGQCGSTLDFTPVNHYQGAFADALSAEDAVVLVNGLCTGTWIHAAAGPVVLTAGHCTALDDRVLVVFNHEEDPDGEELITEGTVIEHSVIPDYALIQLDTLPFTTPVSLTSQGDELLAVIQHPRGLPKVIAEGWYEAACDDLVYYSDLDTLVGTSGAGVLTRQGRLLGIHTDGNCETTGFGTNHGWTAEKIAAASPYLAAEDVLGPP